MNVPGSVRLKLPVSNAPSVAVRVCGSPSSGREKDRRRDDAEEQERKVNRLRVRVVPLGMRGQADERVLTELYREHGQALMGFALRLVDDRAKAEDVVQETMLRCWKNLDAIDPARGNPRSYLFAVARNVVIDLWRAEERRPRLVSDEQALAARSVEDRADALVDAYVVDQALLRLSPEQRAVVDALYFRGATVTEAAQSLGIPAGTVKSRAYYAIRVLRTAFEEMGIPR